MRDIVATIQRHQDEAIRAPARGVTEITGGPGTGKTVVALHRAAYLLYSDRRRFEAGGILVVGPSGAYTAYIERVLPSPRRGDGERCARSATSWTGSPPRGSTRPPSAAIKGSLRIRRLLAPPPRAPRPGRPDRVPGVRGRAGGAARGPRARPGALRRSCARTSATTPPTPPAGPRPRPRGPPATGERERPSSSTGSDDHADVEAFMAVVVAPGRPARGAAVARPTPTPVAHATRAVLSRRGGRRPGRLVSRPRPRDRHVVGGRRRARRRPRRPARRPCRRRRGRSAASTRSRSSTTSPVRRLRGRPARRRAAGHRAPARGGTADPRERLLRGRLGRPGGVRPRARRRGPGLLARCSGGCSAAAAGGRRGRSSATPPRPRGRTPRRRAAAREEAFGSQRARCSTWTPTTATPARSSTTPPTSSAPRCPTPTSPRRCARPGSSPST